MRDLNQALLISSLHQHELNEEAHKVEAALRKSAIALRTQSEELARFNRLAVGRESRIIELKKEVNACARLRGEPERYRLEFDGCDDNAPAESHSADRWPRPLADDIVAPLEEVLCTGELERRSAHSPDYQAENDAFVSLLAVLAERPGDVLQEMAERMLDLLRADSAGLSLLTPDGIAFYWPAIAGMWKPHIGGGTPRDFGPCGDVLDRNAPLLFGDLARRYTYFAAVSPPVKEALLVPFYVEGKAVGTLWAVAHGDKKFDSEDLRQLQSLGRFAAGAYQVTESRAFERARRLAALNLMEDAVDARQAMETVNAELRVLERRTQEQAQSLADLNRRKDHFLAVLSHELRNPLASIRGATHVMRLQQERSPVQVDAQGMIERQVAQLTRLIDDLLEVSRISTGRVRLQLDRVDFRGIVHRAIGASRQQGDRKGQSLEESLPEKPQWVDGDPVRLEQVIVNLLSNACKYTDRGGRIRVSIQRENEHVVLRVRDNGVGISAEMLPRIFDLFTQADQSLDRAQGGLGIGLALVQSLVALHGGQIEVLSTPGEGSEFTIRLPAREAPVETLTSPVKRAALTHAIKVLVVDDNVDAAQSTAILLETMGHHIRIAEDGKQALEVAHEFVPDVILLDIGLPILDGFQVASAIRLDPAIRHAVLVALTGYGQDADKERARAAGFNHHLLKPVDFNEIETILASAAEAGPDSHAS